MHRPRKYSRRYLETRVRTASREELLLMLYDGMLRFLEEARACVREKNVEGAGRAIIRVQDILMELLCALREEKNPEVAANLKSLYLFMHRRLSSRESRHRENILTEIAGLLLSLRDAWRKAMEITRRQRHAATGVVEAAEAGEGAAGKHSLNLHA